jgi:hypothetical protein
LANTSRLFNYPFNCFRPREQGTEGSATSEKIQRPQAGREETHSAAENFGNAKRNSCEA